MMMVMAVAPPLTRRMNRRAQMKGEDDDGDDDENEEDATGSETETGDGAEEGSVPTDEDDKSSKKRYEDFLATTNLQLGKTKRGGSSSDSSFDGKTSKRSDRRRETDKIEFPKKPIESWICCLARRGHESPIDYARDRA